MELVDLENRLKEIEMSIVDFNQLINKTKTEVERYVQEKNDEINKSNIAIVENRGRTKELQKLIEELKKEEGKDGREQ